MWGPRARAAAGPALGLAMAVSLGPALAAIPGSPAASAEPGHDVRPLHFKVVVGPDDDKTCDIVGDLYVPDDASAEDRMPAVLMTNGFGGSKDDQAALAAFFAERGYVALTYSGLGFGGSSCEITLDDRDFDGKAAAALIDFLGGTEGLAFTGYDELTEQHTGPVAALDVVELDGDNEQHDPRVGMLGGSYGGQVQYAAASVSDKLDTIVPIITWNDLSYSLGPNNTSQTSGVTTDVPGAVKLSWVAGFSALGVLADPQNQQPPEPTELPCPNFPEWVCPALAQGVVTGTLSDDAIGRLRDASVSTYVEDVDIPTLILQGQADTLFNLNEAAATYKALQQQGTEVKMSWIEYGHSGAPAPGEMNFAAPDPATQHITKRVTDWFDHYLKQTAAPTGPEFSYFRPWVSYDGIATPAYRSHTRYPVGRDSVYYLSGGKRLLTDPDDVTAGSQSFVTSAAPTGSDGDIDVLGGFLERPGETETDPPGTFAQYSTTPLGHGVEVVGPPRVLLQVEAPTVAPVQGDDTLKLVVFLKVLDVPASGKATVVRNLAAPVRVPDVTRPFTVTMPGFVHRFARGHRIRLVVAGSSPNYLNGRNAAPVTITTARASDGTPASSARAAGVALPLQSITLPTIGKLPPSRSGTTSPPSNSGPGAGGGATEPDGDDGGATGRAGPGAAGDTSPRTDDAQAPAAAAGRAAPGDGSSWLPDTGGPAVWLLLAGALLTGAGTWLVSRRRATGSDATA